ncbi:MAG TPA: formylmethionine deformylase, partial [Catenuloplanes sp.]
MSGGPAAAAAGTSTELAGWTVDALGVPGRPRPVVAAPDPVLGRAGVEVDPTDP